jgi:hypothetical protein
MLRSAPHFSHACITSLFQSRDDAVINRSRLTFEFTCVRRLAQPAVARQVERRVRRLVAQLV